VSAAATQLGHYIAWGVTVLVMLGLIIYVAIKKKQRFGSWWKINGPLLLTVLAALLILADTTRHCLQDIGWWPEPGSSEYREGCKEENFRCYSVVGWLFMVVFTYGGFGLLVVATMWNANICDKIQDFRNKWAELRGHTGNVNEQT